MNQQPTYTTPVALQFAQEILEWKEARQGYGGSSYGKIYRNEKATPKFRIHDLRQVLRFTKWYCNKVGTKIDLNCLYDDMPAEALMRECLALKRLLEKSNEA